MMGALASLWALSVLPTDTLILLTPVAVFGALLPDLDAPRSQIRSLTIGGLTPFWPLAHLLSRTLGHRGLLHSLFGWGMVSLIFALLTGKFGLSLGGALSLGYLSHLGLDACTKRGIPLFFPRATFYHLLPRYLRITTGSKAEEGVLVFLSLVALCLMLQNLHSLTP
jgi:membrane-bound metal-dependent hydrolase YbcI (DUF457 family)